MIEPLGAGGTGDVHLGIDERLDRKVAVKAIRGETRLDDKARARLLREARVLSQLEHPNICRLYEYVQGDDSDFLVLELVEGQTLQDLLADEVMPNDAMEVAEQIVGLFGNYSSMMPPEQKTPAPRRGGLVSELRWIQLLGYVIWACAAARRAIGTRKGEQLT